jgi:hypothetical protein
MSIKITIPNTSSDVLTFGSANTPTAAQIAGIDSGSSNGQLALYTTASGTSTERMRINSSGNVGIGETSPTNTLDVKAALGRIKLTSSTGTNNALFLFNNTGGNAYVGLDSSAGSLTAAYALNLYHEGAYPITFSTNSTERCRITSDGYLLVGTTSTSLTSVGAFISNVGTIFSASATAEYSIFNKLTSTTGKQIEFRSANTNVGNITSTSTATQFNTSSSDYRLKDEVSEFTGGLERIKALRPVSFRWKAQDVHDIGFIAHEMQAIVPECVTGEKDAVDSDGNPEYQSIFPAPAQMIATLVSAIQEQQALITQLQADVAALKGASA